MLSQVLRSSFLVGVSIGLIINITVLTGIRLGRASACPSDCGPVGSSAAPFGDCEEPPTVADVVSVLTELNADLFGESNESIISYNVDQENQFNGAGDFVA
jgi:hypothetical protein